MTYHRETYRLQDSLPTFDGSSLGGELRSRKKSILVVEEEEDRNFALACRLREAGFHVVSSFDALSGLVKTGFHRPDLVLIDLERETLDDLGYLSGFLRIERMRDVPVVVLTLRPETIGDQQAEELGIVDVVEKPASHGLVVERTARALGVDA